ncbi:hypothetical protein EGR_06506 [Echinococcus granulosus]|uniref:Uncharacterized protein n=1 Tax=Echinococcus granulosus TaxID=6210 RepID=W6UB62_ECHGR|nr:hypothetical protein EGR_06506 [Echinococcus granulosus]EUB58623.1 hypothetical protein EGR_06506 [Echinococcus granulosus]
MDHTTSTSLEQIELLPLSQEAHPLPHNTTTTTTTVHESRDKDDEYVEGKSVATPTRPIASPSIATTTTALEPRDLEAGIRKSTTPLDRVDGNVEVVVEEAEEVEDIDKIITLVTRPRSGPRGGSLLRAQKSVVGEIGGNGGELSTLGFINRHDYWEHSAFGRSRITAIVLASMAICCLLYCLVATTWAYSGPQQSHFIIDVEILVENFQTFTTVICVLIPEWNAVLKLISLRCNFTAIDDLVSIRRGTTRIGIVSEGCTTSYQ